MEKAEIQALCALQKEFFHTHQTIPVSWRKSQLKILKQAVKRHEAEILDALYLDLGRSRDESYMVEIGMFYSEVDYMLRHLDGLVAVHYTWTPIHQFPAASMTVDIPYGNVLIMSPWNYPFLLTMQPLVDALAAGNTALLKPSNYSVHTTEIIRKMIAETFQPGYVGVVTGGHEEIQELLSEKFDYIFFTGSPKVGQIVMERASENLTPVSLELGGKSPAVVDETANLAVAAKRIVYGKFLNAGQTCVAPDYVVVQDNVKDEFVQLLCHEVKKQYPNPDFIGKIINEKHFERLIGLVDPKRVLIGGTASAPTRQIAPTIMADITWSDPVMQEEIFGPILPVMTYTSFDELMKEIASKPTPLAFYLFSKDRDHISWYKKIQPFGSGCINDTIMQLSNDHLPFGGMGKSGMGQYHGKYGFETFSHTKAILDKATWLDLPMRYNNRAPWMAALIRKILK